MGNIGSVCLALGIYNESLRFLMKLSLTHGLGVSMEGVCSLVVCKPTPVQGRPLLDEVLVTIVLRCFLNL